MLADRASSIEVQSLATAVVIIVEQYVEQCLRQILACILSSSTLVR